MTSFNSFAAGEPRLDDILSDPIIALVLKRDGLDAGRVASTLAQEQRRLARIGAVPRTRRALAIAA